MKVKTYTIEPPKMKKYVVGDKNYLVEEEIRTTEIVTEYERLRNDKEFINSMKLKDRFWFKAEFLLNDILKFIETKLTK